MLRITGGRLRGQTLSSPKKSTARPTQSKTREAIFNSLQSWIELENIAVLDLFAGTGILGIEAVSRGARSATLVDHSRAGTKVIAQDLERLELNSQCTIKCADSLRAIQKMIQLKQRFGLVFADPPYHRGWWQRLLDARVDLLLERDGVVVLETEKRGGDGPDADSENTSKTVPESVQSPRTQSGNFLVKLRDKNYGDTRLQFFRRRE